MRILQVSSAKNFGGGEKHFIDLSIGLANRGHAIFAALRSQNNWQQKLSFLPEQNLFVLPLKNSIDIFSSRKLATFVIENRIEIIHAHVARDYPVAALAAFISKTPLIITRHLLFPLGKLHYFTLKRTAKIIAVSKGVARGLAANKSIKPEKIALIYNGVDTKLFENAVLDSESIKRTRRKFVPDTDFLIGTIGEIRSHKGQEDFVLAAEIIVKKFDNVKFLIIGADNSKEKHFQTYLENLVEKLDLSDRIFFTGWQENMPVMFSVLDVFVSAARVEPFGLVIAEAMANGKAIVATETNGASEMLEDGKTGKIVPVNKPERLAQAVIEFLQDENVRRTFGANAQKIAKEKFDLTEMVAATEKIYKEVSAN